MNRIVVLVCLLVSISGSAQKSLNDYGYVVVPEQFEFLNDKDKYQLNSITNFTLNKHGFNSYMADKVPNVKRCDGLYADVVKKNHMLRTKLTLILKDCQGEIVYEASEGTSKEKEFRKAYQDALRKSLKSLVLLNVSQPEITVFENEQLEIVNQPQSTNTIKNAPVTGELPTLNNKINTPKNNTKQQFPIRKFSSYSHSGKPYLLRKTAEGYSLYEESAEAEDGLLLRGTISVNENKAIYKDALNEGIYEAMFDASENLTIKNEDSLKIFKAIH